MKIFRIIDDLKRFAARIGRKLAAFGAALVSPIEWMFSFLGRKLFGATERATRLESGLSARIGGLFRGLGRFLGGLVPRSVREVLLVPARAWMRMQRNVVAGLMWLAEALNLDVLFVWLLWLLKPIWYPIAAVLNFLVVWVFTRPYRKMLWGLPAVLLLLPIVVTAAWGALLGHDHVADQYKLALKDALKDKDYARSQLYERKLAQLGVDTNLTDFRTAEALERDGKIADAYERMQRLAPEDKPGYAAAHFWIVQRLLIGKLEVPPDEAQRLINIHLGHLAALSIRGPDIDLLHAFALAQQGQLAEASKLLKPLANKIPLAAVQRMRIDIALHDQEAAEQDATAVRNHMQNRIKKGATLEPDDYRAWAIAEELLGNSGRMRAVLSDWLKIDPNNQSARQDLGAVNLREFVDLLHGPSPDPDDLAKHLRTAFELSSNPEPLKVQVAKLYGQRAQIPELGQAFEMLVKSDDTPAALTETMGTAAALEGDWKSALLCLRRAVAKDPKSAVAWNNLSCVLYQGANPQLDQALEAVNKAIELSPDEFRFRETRGQIYTRQSQWPAAISDLEFALNGMPEAPAIHRALAKAYEAMGNQELAAAHRHYAN
jgi:tetratricopeptide (TPR) repeat protein